jgi:hypothetical protein
MKQSSFTYRIFSGFNPICASLGRIWVFVFFLTALFSCRPSGETNNGVARIEFAQTEFDFGSLQMGEQVSHRFVYKNTGNKDLTIKKVDPSCGCTAVSFTNRPIKPGEESHIDAIFDSRGLRGLNIKEIEVHTNGVPSIVKLIVAATVDID